MQAYLYVALVTLLTALLCFWMGTQVARTRQQVGIFPPVMTGDPKLERTIRAHANTLEWIPIFLPSLWLFAIYGNSTLAAVLGLIWVIGRIVYFLGYVVEPKKRYSGFFIQAAAVGVLALGALGRVIYLLVTSAS